METNKWIETNISGAVHVIDWFGFWPSFHDAEIVEIRLNRKGQSSLKLHVFQMTPEVDERGFFVLDKHAIVTLLLQDVLDLELIGFSHQNVIFGLEIKQDERGVKIILEGCFGIEGWLIAKEAIVQIAPGKPTFDQQSHSPDR